jgi:hypothetical protein
MIQFLFLTAVICLHVVMGNSFVEIDASTERKRVLHTKRDELDNNSELRLTRNLQTQPVDCTAACSFPDATAVTASNAVQTFSLTKSFVFSFGFKPSGTHATETNIIEIVSATLGTSLLGVYLEPQSAQVAVYFMGQKVISYGPGASNGGFTTFTVTVSGTSLSVSNSAYAVVSTTAITPIASDSNTLYVSGAGPSSGGTVNSITVSGM